MTPLRVLHVTPYYADAWAYGGIPRAAATLTRALARRGHHVTVATTDARDRDSRAIAGARVDDGVHVWLFPNLANRLAYDLQLFVPLGLGRWLREHAREFDVAHVHGCHHLPGAIAARALRRVGVPYVLAPHGTAPRIERRRTLKRLFDATVGRGVIRGAARIVAVSHAEQRQLSVLGIPASAIQVIPNPLDLSEFDAPLARGAFRARSGLGDRPVVTFLGKLTPRKNVDVLVEAVATLARQDVALVIAGNDLGAGWRLRRLVARRGLASQTMFTGLLSGRARLEALADADVIAYPSTHEVFGLVPLEALLVGTPVVVAGDSGCGEVIRSVGGGQIVRERDPGELADAIRRTLDRLPEARAEAMAAQWRVRKVYAPEVVCDDLEGLYLGLVDEQRRTSRTTSPSGIP